MDNQQGPTISIWNSAHMVLCVSLDGMGFWRRMDTCICMAESLCYSSETITILLIGYTPIQSFFFFNSVVLAQKQLYRSKEQKVGLNTDQMLHIEL